MISFCIAPPPVAATQQNRGREITAQNASLAMSRVRDRCSVRERHDAFSIASFLDGEIAQCLRRFDRKTFAIAIILRRE